MTGKIVQYYEYEYSHYKTMYLITYSAIWRLAKKIMGYLIILIKGQRMTYFVSKNATFTNQSQFHNLVTQ